MVAMIKTTRTIVKYRKYFTMDFGTHILLVLLCIINFSVVLMSKETVTVGKHLYFLNQSRVRLFKK